MDEISNADKIAAINQKIAAYRRAHYDAKLDAEIGKDLDMEQLVTQAMGRMKTALQAVGLLEKMRAELEKQVSESG